MKYFTTKIDEYLVYWIKIETWYTPNDIEDNFWRFIFAIYYYSKPLKDKSLNPDDPSLSNLPEHIQMREANKRTQRNPRTYDESDLKHKILLAVKQNYPSFDMKYAEKLVTDLCEKAMIVLDALWFAKVKIKHFTRVKR